MSVHPTTDGNSLPALRARQDQLVYSLSVENSMDRLAAQSEELEQILRRIQELEQQ
jgi:proteasome assembly chaperone (PAC2) family protein